MPVANKMFESTCLSNITPEHVVLGSSGKWMPALGLGMAVSSPVGPEATKMAVLKAIEVGYRHFDTASIYGTEEPLGEAIAEALSTGLIQSRDELFITTKLWCTDAHGQHVVPALKRSLQNLKLEYVDLYLIHWPFSFTKGIQRRRSPDEDVLPMDFSAVWADMEQCHNSLGLTKSIGVSNFSCKQLAHILAIANIPPAVNQVEMNPLWQQKQLREFCNANGIHLSAYSVLGAIGTSWGSNRVMECQVLKEIAKARGKTLPQVCLRWAYEQGVSVIVKSFNPERMKENLDIFKWSLKEEDVEKINHIQQSRSVKAEAFVSQNGLFKTLEELWDDEI